MTKITSTIHNHTTYCDGTASIQEMVRAAIQQKLSCIGFSGHSYMNFDESYAMSLAGTLQYMEEIRQVKRDYGDQIEILLGIEWDSRSDWKDYAAIEPAVRPGDFDYRIASVHTSHGPLTGKNYALDYLPEILNACIHEGFGGDVQAMITAYYQDIVDLYQQECQGEVVDELERQNGTCPIFMGHFDLITKLNGNGTFFDEDSYSYQNAASTALEKLVRQGAIIEVNTGGVYRGYRKAPYPADFLLRQICDMGGKVMLSADAHDAKGLTFLFDETVKYLKKIGLKQVVQMTGNGLQAIEL